MSLKAVGLNCTLKASPSPSSTQKLLDEVLDALKGRGVETTSIRLADHDIKPGVTADEGEGDAWPDIRRQIYDAHILIVGTPIWMGQPSSVVKRAMERLDAVFDEAQDDGRYPTYGKVAGVVVVGNEDGAHHVSAELYQALADVGFTIPAGSSAYWVGEAMGSKNYIDLPKTPEKVNETVQTLARHCFHLAGLLDRHPYPAP
ncbi:flavodoxin family protein [Pinirhizobacter soli]|uniref:flavodoxin family protein n=1 Tax=Pinirhizobacter soli TaxID=2786953 RepID=UPI00202A10E7|nr:flavodoxin family protein [Pinirhizobacter soli]